MRLLTALLAFAFLAPAALAQVYPSTDTPRAIPNNNPVGVASTLVVPPGASTIADLDVRLDVTREFVGGLRVVLSKGGVSAVLLDRPRFPGTTNGCGGDNVNAFADDEAAEGSFESVCVNLLNVPGYQTDSRYTPNSPLSAFDGQPAAGTWTLTVSDLIGGGGTLDGWALVANTSTVATIVESGDAGNVVNTAAQNAQNRAVDRITGSIAFGDDEDCYAVTVTEPGRFSASVVSFGNSRNSQLFLFDQDRNGVYADDNLGAGLLPAIDVTEFAAGGGTSGGYVLCVTGFDDDPENAAAAEIFGEGSGTPVAADRRLAAWDDIGFVDGATYDIRLTGTGTPTGAETGPAGGFALPAPVPNPAGGTARLTLDLAETQAVTAEVYDALGRRVAVLHDGPLAAGTHPLTLDASALAPGVYIVRAAGARGEHAISRLVVAR